MGDHFVPGTHILLQSAPDSSERSQRSSFHRYMANSICYRICATFEVRVRSQSLSTIDFSEAAAGSSEIGSTAINGSGNGPRYWTTKEADACVLTALMVLLSPV